LRAATALPELETQYIDWDMRHVENKFPKLMLLGQQPQGEHHWFVKRLGLAMTRRRQYLRYCQDHASQISTIRKDPKAAEPDPAQPLPVTSESEFQVHQPVVEPPPPRSTTTLTTPSTFVEENIVNDVDKIEEQEADEDIAPSIQATSVGTVEGETPAIVRLENLRKGNIEFICPFCTQPKKFRRNRAWK
jgi:hypothetical protein